MKLTKLLLAVAMFGPLSEAATPPERPHIVGIASIAVKVESLDVAREFYSGVIGPEDAFTTKGSLVCFKVNDRQYVEVFPELTGASEDRLIRIDFEMADARKLQAYLKTVVERGYRPPREPAIGRDGRWLLQLFDKNFTRTELMVRKPVETPCCSPMRDDL